MRYIYTKHLPLDYLKMILKVKFDNGIGNEFLVFIHNYVCILYFLSVIFAYIHIIVYYITNLIDNIAI